MPKHDSFGAFSRFFGNPDVILVKIFFARALGAREYLLAFIGGRRAQNQRIRESKRLAYPEKTRW